ncbi:phosphatase PAP2 family protein [Salimicrobium halophilum]|uniref:Undecaprenyl-diphosphatase n=1 Tax=Salimicrobium halophilum TaxID=86666 RepID=A0A1G8TX46_9BACI|nr:phosphatase PAP2 family protein [Salimicrobium halophilum]SDJ46156.1 undecaprenyl-diphosphatase [Salimicrobium halophilum]
MYFSNKKFTELNTGRKSLLYAALLFVLVGVAMSIWITLAITPKDKLAIDEAAFDVVRAIHVPVVAAIFKGISKLGSVPVLATASVLIAIYFLFLSSFSRWLALYFAIAMGGVSGITKLAKSLTSRDRPEFLGGYDGATSSYPSGHASGAVVFYGFLIYILGAQAIGRKWKWMINTLLVLIVLGISFSRVYLGVHYFTDIVSGIFLGCLWLLLCIIGVEVTLRRKAKKEKEEAA